MADLGRWQVVVRGSSFIDELRRAPNDVLSFQEATDEVRASVIPHYILLIMFL